MKNKITGLNFLKLIQNLFLLILGLSLVLLEHPNRINNEGFGFLAWISYIPILFLIQKNSLKHIWYYGLIYGFFYGFFYFFWLRNYDSYGIYAISLYFTIVMCLFFISLKAIHLLNDSFFWLNAWIFICSFEYICTKGFMGLGFVVSAYSLWKNTILLQFCSFTGVFGLNLLVIFPSCCIFGFISKLKQRKRVLFERDHDDEFYDCKTHVNYVSKYDRQLKKIGLQFTVIGAIVYGCCLCSVIVTGIISVKKKTASDQTVKIAAVQINEDPFENGIEVYRKNVQRLLSISDNLLELYPNVDMIVWPETAVVPAIVYQYESKKDEKRYKLVDWILSYLNNQNATFVIGNGHTVLDDDVKTRYNSALVFTPGKNVIPPNPEVYSKNHLVPFSEYFPFEKILPRFTALVKKLEPDMWTPGSEIKVFQLKDLYYSTPICFEDNFSDICREMYKKGARCFINLSNDSWSKSIVCQYEHLAMAVFRCVENKIPAIRCTTSGMTCMIDENGKVQKIVPAFSENYLLAEVPVISKNRKPTFYNKTGDFCGYGSCIVFGILLLIQLILVIISKKKTTAGE